MLTEAIRPEVINSVVDSLFLLGPAVLGMAYTIRQKEWFRKVFEGKCQGSAIGMRHKCGGDLQLHHIQPQGWMYARGYTSDEIDTDTNGIFLCADAHVGERGTKDCIHPDQIGIKNEFSHNGDAYHELQRRRIEKAERGEVYWNSKWDFNLQRRANDLVRKFKQRHPNEPYPINGHNGKTR